MYMLQNMHIRTERRYLRSIEQRYIRFVGLTVPKTKNVRIRKRVFPSTKFRTAYLHKYHDFQKFHLRSYTP